MLENGKISVRQFVEFVFLITIGDSILVLPSIPAFEAKQDAWISSIIGLVIGLLIVNLFTTVGKLYPRLTLVEYNKKILGKWFGTAVILLFLPYLFLSAAAHVRQIGDFMTTQILPETPIQAIHIIFLSIIIMGVRLGLETMARAGEILCPWFIMFFIAFIIFLSPQIELERMQPILAEGFKPVLRGSLASISFPFMELVVFLMIFPYVDRPKEIRRSFLLGALLGGIVLITIIAISILVLGADLTARNMYSSYSVAREINIGDFLQRDEIIIAIMWFITSFFKITLYFYVFNLGVAQLLKLKEYRMLTLPFGMILVVLSLVIAPNITYYNNAIAKYWSYYDLTYSVLLPLMLLGMYTFRKKLTREQMI